MQRILSVIAVCAVVLFAVSCENKTEEDDLASAQKCLDNVPEGQPAAANTCLPMVKDYTSVQANILRCSIIMTSGGLMENKIVAAYNALKDSTQTNKVASFMAVLGLDYPDVNTGYTKAVQANQYCQETGVLGLMYISNIIVAGSLMDVAIGSGLDITDPSSINTAVSNMVTQCAGSSPPASCTTNLPTLGATATNLANTYCTQSGADQTVCGQINGAVNAGGGNSTNVGQALFCYLNNKTYDPATSACQ